MSDQEDFKRLTDLLREIQVREQEQIDSTAMFQAMVKDLARKLAVSEERVCEMIGVNHGG